LRHIFGKEDVVRILSSTVDPTRIAQIVEIAEWPQFSPLTSSIGRLFDAAAVIVLGFQTTRFEGQPAMTLEAMCDHNACGSYSLPLVADNCQEPAELDWRPLFSDLIADRGRGTSPGTMAMRFHRALAQAVIDVARHFPQYPVVLAGGVFQNRVLVEMIAENWTNEMQPLGLPGIIPPGDGGLAVGQLAIGLSRINERGVQPCV
jgi:hydrogenase maturation protein HypF